MLQPSRNYTPHVTAIRAKRASSWLQTSPISQISPTTSASHTKNYPSSAPPRSSSQSATISCQACREKMVRWHFAWSNCHNSTNLSRSPDRCSLRAQISRAYRQPPTFARQSTTSATKSRSTSTAGECSKIARPASSNLKMAHCASCANLSPRFTQKIAPTLYTAEPAHFIPAK